MTETMPFELFRTTIGLDRVTSLPEMAPLEFTAEEPEDRGRISTLSEALDAVLEEVNQREGLSEDEDDRRSHQRVAHSQFLRFRPEGNSSAVMAYLGDLSEGGIFVRTAEQPPHTTRVSVDFHVMHLDQRFRVCCPGEVAWLAEGEDDSPHGAGFGIRFVDAPTDVKELLRDIVRKRTQQAGKTPA